MFLNKRGFTKGIVINKNVKFTEEETLLFSEDLKNHSMPSFDTIDSKLDSDESENNEVHFVSSKSSYNGHHSTNPSKLFDNSFNKSSDGSIDCNTVLKCFTKTSIWRKSFKNLIYFANVDFSTLKKFVTSGIFDDNSFKIILDQQNEIIDKFKGNNRKETELDSLIHTIRLLHENIQTLRGVSYSHYPLANDFRNAKGVLFRLIHDTNLVYLILNAGYDLPLRTIFPDTTMGDFLFSKFIKANLENEINRNADATTNSLFSICKTHFMSSKIFQSISDVFKTNQNSKCFNYN